MNYQNKGFNVNPNRNKRTLGRKVRIHPLDLSGRRRIIGETVFDPVSRTWKVDDGRPRGWFEDPVTGQVAGGCWGSCKIRKWFRTRVKCDCNFNTNSNSCQCDGCMSNAGC